MKNLKFSHAIFNISLVLVFLVTAAFTTRTDDEEDKRKIQIALLLDTSNSMDGLIDQAKSQLWNIVDELSKAKYGEEDPELEIALYEYGNSNLSATDDYIRQVQPLITDLDKTSINLFSLKTNGGQEYCGSVIQEATKKLEWTSNAKDIHMIFIAGNEPFTQGEISYEAACGAARAKDIIINTIHCGSERDGINGKWKSGAIIGGGDFMTIDQNRKTVYIATPYDARINELSIQLNQTYIYYGTQGYYKKQEQEMADEQAASYSQSNLSKRNKVKTSKYYKNSSWDLVDASDQAEFDIKKVEKKTLPKELQGMTDAQLEAYVAKKKKERENIKSQIVVLTKAQSEYIAKKKKENTANSVESSMIAAIKKQAQKKKYNW
jgi:Tfp pilus assembly protein PilV